MKNRNGCWLELEGEFRGIEYPISDLISTLVPLIDVRATVHCWGVNDKKGQDYLVELDSPFGSGMLSQLRKTLVSRKERLATEGMPTDRLGIEIVSDSLRTIEGRDIISCWVTSPIFDLLLGQPESILKEYHWLDHNPHEYFFLYGNKKLFMTTILPNLHKKAGNNPGGLQWKFSTSPRRTRYKGLSLLEDHYFNTALETGYFQSFDRKLLGKVAAENTAITGEPTDMSELSNKMLLIANKIFKKSEEII